MVVSAVVASAMPERPSPGRLESAEESLLRCLANNSDVLSVGARLELLVVVLRLES